METHAKTSEVMNVKFHGRAEAEIGPEIENPGHGAAAGIETEIEGFGPEDKIDDDKGRTFPYGGHFFCLPSASYL